MKSHAVAPVSLRLKDGVVVPVPPCVLEFSKDLAPFKGEVGWAAAVLEFPTISQETFAKVVEFCDWHSKNPQPNDHAELSHSDRYFEVLCDYDKAFTEMKVDPETGVLQNHSIMQVFNASDFLGISCLHWACAHSLADHIKNKTTAELRVLLGIKDE